jgi:hypothetical protein
MVKPGNIPRERHVIPNWLVVTLAGVPGYVVPGGMLWGIHFLRFLSPPYLTCYVVLSLGAILFSMRGEVDKDGGTSW